MVQPMPPADPHLKRPWGVELDDEVIADIRGRLPQATLELAEEQHLAAKRYSPCGCWICFINFLHTSGPFYGPVYREHPHWVLFQAIKGAFDARRVEIAGPGLSPRAAEERNAVATPPTVAPVAPKAPPSSPTRLKPVRPSRDFRASDDAFARELLEKKGAGKDPAAFRLEFWRWATEEGYRLPGRGKEPAKVRRLSVALKRVSSVSNQTQQTQ